MVRLMSGHLLRTTAIDPVKSFGLSKTVNLGCCDRSKDFLVEVTQKFASNSSPPNVT